MSERELVIAKIRQCFPDKALEEILSILDLYGVESYERERERVQLAILKLSGGDMEQLRQNVALAKRDYRDALAYAEYPGEMQRATWRMGEGEAGKVREEDRRQYLDWLNERD